MTVISKTTADLRKTLRSRRLRMNTEKEKSLIEAELEKIGCRLCHAGTTPGDRTAMDTYSILDATNGTFVFEGAVTLNQLWYALDLDERA